MAAAAIVLASCASDDVAGERVEVTPDLFMPELVLSEWKIEGDLVVPEGQIIAQVLNFGFTEHNVGLEGGPFSSTLFSDEEEAFDLGTLEPGTYVLYCDIEGHRSSGMETTLTVLAVTDGAMTVPFDE